MVGTKYHKYYDVVVNQTDYRANCRIERGNKHQGYISLDELTGYISKELKDALVTGFIVSRSEIRGKCQSIMLTATTYDDGSTKRTVTFDIEARGAEDPLYDEDGNQCLFSVVYGDLDRDDVYAIANISVVRKYLENEEE